MTESYKPASVRNRYTGVRQFFAWCLEEGEITETPLRNIPPPAIPENPPPVLSAAQIKALFKVCSGPTFEDRRDTAIVAVLLDAGLRLGELVGHDARRRRPRDADDHGPREGSASADGGARREVAAGRRPLPPGSTVPPRRSSSTPCGSGSAVR